MNLCYYFLWGYFKDRVYRTNPHTAQELQAEIEAVAEEIRGGTLSDTVDNFVVRLQPVQRSHLEHVFT
jgi:hypothetical protein